MQDKLLLDLLLCKPNKGIERIMKEYTGFVYAIAKSRLANAGTTEDIEELVSDVFFHLYEQRESINLEKGSIKTWLAVITTRKAVDLYRKIKSKRAFSINEATVCDEDVLKKHEDKALVVAAIRELGDPDSEILLRKIYMGQTSAEIAQLKGMSTSAVEKRISRSYNRLRILLGGEAL